MASSYQVLRCEPELIRPAIPTPHEYKHLSTIDSQHSMRLHTWLLLVYRTDSKRTIDPVRLVRDGLAKALVFYYPLAGRLREGSDQKLVVECTGEGVLFIEGDADFSVEEMAAEPHGSAPYYDELIHDVPGSDGIIGCPLVLLQVTRLKCGGFTIGLRANHVLMDASGKGQFLKAIAEMAQGVAVPSVLPVWERELLSARDPLRATHKNLGYDLKKCEEQQSKERGETKDLGRMNSRSFFFGLLELSALRRSLPEVLQNCTTFEVLTAFLWRSRVVAFDLDSEDDVMLSFLMDIRRKINPNLPKGYYGNTVIHTFAVTTAGKLRESPLEYAVALVRKAKYSVDDELVRSRIELIGGREKSTQPTPASLYVVTDLTRTGVANPDFGWGKPVFTISHAVPPRECLIGVVNRFTPAIDCNGEEQVMVPMDLPEKVMERMACLIDDLQLIKTSCP